MAIKIGWIRRFFQLGCFILFNAGIWGLGPWEVVIPALVSMHGNSKTVVGALTLIQYMLAKNVFPWTALASTFLFAALTGRFACGWICPFGFIQDILSAINRDEVEVSPRTHRPLLKLKYAILIVILLISFLLFTVSRIDVDAETSYREALGPFSEGPFNSVSPSSTLFALIPQLPQRWLRIAEDYDFEGLYTFEGAQRLLAAFFTPLLGIRLAILLLVLASSAYIARFWCKYLCPQGAFLALLSRHSLVGLRREPAMCTRCRQCVENCPMEVDLLEAWWEKISDPECILCLECLDSCEHDALRLRIG